VGTGALTWTVNMWIIELLDVPVSWVLVQFFTLFTGLGFSETSGWTWVMSIVGLVIIMRILLIPLFVKQIKAQRGLQLIQPQMKEIQKKYAGDRERQSQEMMKLYKETGTNPLASCLPILLQAPIFFALFRVLQYGIAQEQQIGVFLWEQYQYLIPIAHDASIFGVPLYATFLNANEVAADGFSPANARVLALILIILMSSTTFLTQRQLIVKNTAPDNPMVRQQKILLYVFPLIFAVAGVNFPIGVLIYWFTTNLWSMGQQFYVIRNNPQPGTPAFIAKEKRKAERAKRRGKSPEVAEGATETEEAPPPPRVQPKRTPRSKRKRK
jgi:YidC/Oxa1 family membrane protein insertase